MILADALRVDRDNKDDSEDQETVKLTTKEDIKNYINRMM